MFDWLQVRVLNNSCIVADDFRDAIHGCYDAFYSGVEEKKPFGIKNGTAYVSHACLHASQKTVLCLLCAYPS